jgi:Skp family chaperone for outer membrane proteins
MVQVDGRVQARNEPGRSTNSYKENRTVKRTISVLAGVAVLGVLGYLSSRLWAQAPGAQPRVSVALINLPQTLNLYEKFKAYQTEFKGKMDKAFAEDDKLKTDLAKYMSITQSNDPKYTPKDKENAEAWVTSLKRQREDLAAKIKKDFGNKSAEQFVAMYKEVEDAVKAYAKPNGFTVVLHYSDHAEKNDAEKYSPEALQRKLANGACMPLYVQDGVDITNTIAAILNQTYRSRAAQPIVPTSGVSTPPPQKKG